MEDLLQKLEMSCPGDYPTHVVLSEKKKLGELTGEFTTLPLVSSCAVPLLIFKISFDEVIIF